MCGCSEEEERDAAARKTLCSSLAHRNTFAEALAFSRHEMLDRRIRGARGILVASENPVIRFTMMVFWRGRKEESSHMPKMSRFEGFAMLCQPFTEELHGRPPCRFRKGTWGGVHEGEGY